MVGPPADVHPVLRRAPAPPAALDLLAQAERGLEEAETREDPGDAYIAAHMAALRTAAAVLAVHGRPETTARGRRRIRSVWDMLPEIAPELGEWSVLFAASGARRARLEAGIRREVGRDDAEELAKSVGMFLRLVRARIAPQPVLPRDPNRPGPGERTA
ncbi:SAV_6107 family HEPN domain-containing protein [Streptomyces sp. ST2-7A]|uniref:SAV_6107 family HEPN domain-containing protein n=1 Tax=Streptomyces sp. ST2-7A TaxID=2907214 RepID=UPI001F37E4F1|nr:SAV_6107 family HEPN domain-containing protein [Streptomyces sp. ST2-7A]MCE7083142.1 hypothetical protein [Streptomyces sp. ST2-7A]